MNEFNQRLNEVENHLQHNDLDLGYRRYCERAYGSSKLDRLTGSLSCHHQGDTLVFFKEEIKK